MWQFDTFGCGAVKKGEFSISRNTAYNHQRACLSDTERARESSQHPKKKRRLAECIIS